MNSTLLAKAISKVFLGIGGLIFFLGDRALREIWQVSLVPAELLGIGGGIAVMLLGAAIQPAATKSSTADPGSPNRQG